MKYSKDQEAKFIAESQAKDHYFVAAKVLLRRGDELLVTHDVFGAWDVPGGRIRTDQFEVPMETILDLKIREELGDQIQYKLGSIETTFRIERTTEAGYGDNPVRIFAVGYEAEYLGGEVVLGDHHDQYEWINLRTTDLSKYASPGGWVEQLAEYAQRLYA